MTMWEIVIIIHLIPHLFGYVKVHYGNHIGKYWHYKTTISWTTMYMHVIVLSIGQMSATNCEEIKLVQVCALTHTEWSILYYRLVCIHYMCYYSAFRFNVI